MTASSLSAGRILGHYIHCTQKRGVESKGDQLTEQNFKEAGVGVEASCVENGVVSSVEGGQLPF